jgi:quercetin dioxygenase-like cupin family protein
MVKFAPGARTVWHSHGLGQTLYIVEGIALVQSRGGEIVEAHPGDVIYTLLGEQHWHGATPDHFMIHLALCESPGSGGAENTWLEHVSDAEYHGPRASTRR